jgi:D-3-phosphoglycerate dehydrogenase
MPKILAALSDAYLNAAPELVTRLRLAGFEVDVLPTRSQAPRPRALQAALKFCDALVVGNEPVGADELSDASRLRLIVRFGSGYENIDIDKATRQGVLVANIPDANIRAVAEMTIGLMIACARQFIQLDRLVRSGTWSKPLGTELCEKTLGVVGTGKVGRAVISLARSFGVKLVGYDKVQDLGFAEGVGLQYLPLCQLMAASDFVTIHVPWSKETVGLIGEPELQAVKPGAILVSISRGGIVDEAALFRVLESGRLRAAALDVWTTEPVVNHPLLELENLIATPHVGGSTVEAARRLATAAFDAISKFFAGGMPDSVVNPEALHGPRHLRDLQASQ